MDIGNQLTKIKILERSQHITRFRRIKRIMCFFSPTIHVIFHINISLHSYAEKIDLTHASVRINLTPKLGLLNQRLQTGAQGPD